MNKKIDPEPITTIAAVAGIVSASMATANFLITHFKELPSVTRQKLLAELDQLAEDIAHMQVDVELIEGIFIRADYPNGRVVRFGNSALISIEDFKRYERLSDSVLQRVRSINKHTLKIERLVIKMGSFNVNQTNTIGDVLGHLQYIFRADNLKVEQAWEILRKVIEKLTEMITLLRSDLN